MKCKLFACVFFLLLCSACSLPGLASDMPAHLNSTAVERIQKSLGESDNFTFALVGDSRDNPDKFREVLAKAAAHAPAFIVHTGDFTSIGSPDQYRLAASIMQGCGVPFLVVPGNHDVPVLGRKLFRKMFGPTDFYVRAGAFCFIFIDSTDDRFEAGFISLPGGDAEKPLADLLSTEGNAILVAHMPPSAPPLQVHGADAITGPFIGLIRTYAPHIRAVLCGHLHGYGHAVVAGVPIIVSGGAGAPIDPTRGAGFERRYNFVLVSVRGRTLSHTVHFVD